MRTRFGFNDLATVFSDFLCLSLFSVGFFTFALLFHALPFFLLLLRFQFGKFFLGISQLAREIIGHFASVENAQILKQYIVLPKAAAKDEIFFSFTWHFVFFQISAYKKADNRLELSAEGCIVFVTR